MSEGQGIKYPSPAKVGAPCHRHSEAELGFTVSRFLPISSFSSLLTDARDANPFNSNIEHAFLRQWSQHEQAGVNRGLHPRPESLS